MSQPTPIWSTCTEPVDHGPHPWHDPWPLPHGQEAHCPGRPTPEPRQGQPTTGEGRLTVDTITSDQLDELYRRAEIADAVTAETKKLLERRTTTLRQRAERAEASIARVRALHTTWKLSEASPNTYCAHCQQGGGLYRWPCPTIAALDEPKES